MSKEDGKVDIIDLHFHTCNRRNLRDPPSQCTFELFQDYNNIINIKLVSIEIPSTWYMITKNNNKFIIRFKFNKDYKRQPKDGNDCDCHGNPYDKMPKEVCIEMEPGNYSIDKFTVVLNGLLRQIPKSCHEHVKVRAEFNECTLRYKLCFEFLTGKVKTATVIFVEEPVTRKKLCTSLGWLMGFREPKYIIENDFHCDEYESCIESEGLFNGSKDRYLYFALEEQQSYDNTNKICLYDQVIERYILGKIVIHDGAFSIIMHEYDDANKILTTFLKKVKRIRQLGIAILDEWGDVVDMNNMDFSFTLQFIRIYNHIRYPIS